MTYAFLKQASHVIDIFIGMLPSTVTWLCITRWDHLQRHISKTVRDTGETRFQSCGVSSILYEIMCNMLKKIFIRRFELSFFSFNQSLKMTVITCINGALKDRLTFIKQTDKSKKSAIYFNKIVN